MHSYRYRGKPDQVLASPAFADAGLPGGFSFFSWSELSPVERQAIQERQAGGGWYPCALDFFQLEGFIEPAAGVGLHFDGRVVGWIVTHGKGPETVQYTNLFVSREVRSVRRAGLTIALIAEALRRQITRGIPIGVFQVEADNQPLLRFTRRYLEPYMTMSELRVARKLLALPSGP